MLYFHFLPNGSELRMEVGATIRLPLGSSQGSTLGSTLGSTRGTTPGTTLGTELGRRLGLILGVELGTATGSCTVIRGRNDSHADVVHNPSGLIELDILLVFFFFFFFPTWR